jgi:tetrahydromethanopterin S-methyltransferase subunit G
MDKSEILWLFFTLMAFNIFSAYQLMRYIGGRLDKIEQRLDFINQKIPINF